jgi:hypothetical protein
MRLEPARGFVDDGVKGATIMTHPAKLADPKTPIETQPEYTRADSILFQAWLVLFLLVICFALVNYLMTYVPKLGL